MHCTHTFPSTITPITQLSPFTHLVLIASPHLHLILTLTYKQHTYTHPVRSLVFPWLTFPSVLPSLSFRVLPGLLTSSPDRLLACLSDLACLLVILCLPPALTHCSASDFDSALSTLPSIPLLDICLFDLVLIKLLVDLLSPLTCHSLQKTSPRMHPAVKLIYSARVQVHWGLCRGLPRTGTPDSYRQQYA